MHVTGVVVTPVTEQLAQAGGKDCDMTKHRVRHPAIVDRSVDLSTLRTAKDFDAEEAVFVVRVRLEMNLQQTGHPLHHLTADGTVVDTDPTLEYLMGKLAAKPTVPVDRRHYGFDPYEAN